MTDRGRGRRENLAVTAFSLFMNGVFLPTQHSKKYSKRQSQRSDLALLLWESLIFMKIFLLLEGRGFAGDIHILPI